MRQYARRLFAAALGLAMLFSLCPAALAESDADAAELTDTLELETLPAPVDETALPEPEAVAETAVESEPQADGDASELSGEARSVADSATLQNVPDTDNETYVLMNIPYADFYAAELGADDMTADTVTSATPKASNSAIVGGSYHDGESSTNILGVTYPVRVESTSVLSAYRKADSEEALFSGGSYAYVPLSGTPTNYKVLTLNETGKASFSAVQSGTSKETLSAELNLTVLTRRGDYEITYRDENAVKAIADSVVLGQILTASDGHKYALRHLENIWENIEMALCTGHSDTIKNVKKEAALTPSQSGYAGLEGATVTGITYYVKNADGQYQTFEVGVNLPIPAYPKASFTDSRSIQLTGLPQTDLETVRTVTKESPENAGTAKERFYAAYVTKQEAETTQPLVLTENPISMEVSDDGAVIIRTENAAESGVQYAVRVIQDRTKRATPDQLLLINADAVWGESSGGEQAQDTAGYVLMNIPYADFYAAELNENAAAVDAVTSATKMKPRTGGLAGGSYHVNKDGSDISGVIYPVFVQDMSALKDKKQVTDSDSVSITVTNRGQESTTEYKGRDALFENPSYAYYILNEKPARYKVLTVGDGGAFTFGAVSGRAATVEGVTAKVNYETHHGNDAEIVLTGTGIESEAIVGGVIVTDSDGVKYGLTHIEGIWRQTQIGWRDTSNVAGKTFTNVRFILRDKVLDCPLEFTVKPKLNAEITAEFTGTRELSVSGTEGMTNAKVTVTYTTGERPNIETHTVADNADIVNGKVTLTEDAVSGQAYTVKIVSDNYADKSVSNVKLADKPDTPDKPDDKPDTPDTPDKPDNKTDTPDNPDKPDTSDDTNTVRGGCYVATAVYGSYDCPEVWTLRRFRDNVLAETWYGRLFIRLYYAVSPTAVELFGDTQVFQDFFRARLDTLVSELQADGVESTPYEDKAW